MKFNTRAIEELQSMLSLVSLQFLQYTGSPTVDFAERLCFQQVFSLTLFCFADCEMRFQMESMAQTNLAH